MTSRAQQFRVAIRKFGPFEAAIAKAWEGFAAQEGLDLQLDAQALDLHPLEEALFTSGGLKNGDWDVAFIVTDWVAMAHQNGDLFDMAPLIAANPPEDYPQGWTDSLLRMQRLGDAVIGLPYHDGPEVFIYRRDLFEDPIQQAAFQAKHGKTLRLPETWDEFTEVARFFTRPDEKLYGTVFAAFPDGHNTVYDFALQLWTRGGALYDSTGRVKINTPAAERGLSFYRAILNDPTAIHPGAREMDSVKSGFAFAHGEVAMMVNWFGFATMCQTIEESRVKDKVMIGPIPHEADSASASLNVYWILSIGAGSPHKELAYRFLRHCASAAMDKALTLEGAIGCRKSSWADAQVNQVIPFYSALETLHQNARELPRLTNWTQIGAVIDELVLATINTQEPVRDLLGRAQAKIDAILA